MNTLGSWIDPQIMAGAAKDLVGRASLAEEFAALLSGPSEPAPLRLDDFTKPVSAPPATVAKELPLEDKTKVRNLLEEVKRRASVSGLLKDASGAAPVTPSKPIEQEAILTRRSLPFFVPPIGPLATRVRAFMDWLKRQVQAEKMFLLDAQGCPLSDAEPDAELLASALVLSEAARRAARHLPTTGEGAVQIDLPQQKKLCVISAETTYGNFCLGLITSEQLAPANADRLRRALQRTVEADSETGPVRIERH
jgi:hypothetical protein